MSEIEAIPVAEAPRDYPPGDYAIVEIMGHTTLVGRIQEVDRFGTKMLAIEPLFADEFLPVVFQGGASIYRLTQCSAAIAFKQQPQHDWQLPTAIRCTVPTPALAAPVREAEVHGAQSDFDPDDFDPCEDDALGNAAMNDDPGMG